MSEAVVLAKVTCRQCGATFNMRWDEPEKPELPVPCPLDGGDTIIKVRNTKDGAGTWVVVEASPAEPEPAPEPEEQPQP